MAKEFFKELKEINSKKLKCAIENMDLDLGIIKNLKERSNPNENLKRILFNLGKKNLKKIGFKKFTNKFYFFPLKLALILKLDKELSKEIKLEHYKGKEKALADIPTEDLPYYGISIINKYKVKIPIEIVGSLQEYEEDIEIPEDVEEKDIEGFMEDNAGITISYLEEEIRNGIERFFEKNKKMMLDRVIVDIISNIIIIKTVPVKKKKIKKQVQKLIKFLQRYSENIKISPDKEIIFEKIKQTD